MIQKSNDRDQLERNLVKKIRKERMIYINFENSLDIVFISVKWPKCMSIYQKSPYQIISILPYSW